jgi:hypothetical protein
MSADYIVCPCIEDAADLRTVRRLVATYGVSLLLQALQTEVVRVQQSDQMPPIAQRALAGLAARLRCLHRKAETVEEDCLPDYALAQRSDALGDEEEAVASPKHVLVYVHRHGIEASAYEARDEAERAACHLALAGLEEIEDVVARRAIVDAMKAGNRADAILLYSAAHREQLEVVEGSALPADEEGLERHVEATLSRLNGTRARAAEAVA